MKRIFVILSFLILLFYIWQIWKDYNRPYLVYQKEFKELLKQKGGGEAELDDVKFVVRQRWLEKLNRVDRCETCHLGVEDPRFVDAPQPYTTHPDADKHSFERFGCTVCHGGQGLATSVEDAHGPTEDWYKAISSDNFLENSCSKCHGDFIEQEAPVLAKGRTMFKEYGCRGCHNVQGLERVKVAPPLVKIGEKVKIDWLYRWLQNPQMYLPETKMPNFQLTKEEAADMTRFLIPRVRIKDPDNFEGGSYARGKRILSESRCVTCHSFEGKGGDIGPDLAKVSSKVYPEWLFEWIKNPQAMRPDTLMPAYGFSDQDIRDLVAFIVEEYIDLELEDDVIQQNIQFVESANVGRGKELIEKYGCTGCHEIEGVEDRGEIGLDLTAIGDSHISRMDFGMIEVSHEERTVPNWLYNKMKNPRLFKAGLKMPDFTFSDLEAEALTTYLMSRSKEVVPASYHLHLGERPSDYNPQGEFGEILDNYRCLVCHTINGRGGDLAPDISIEGSRVKEKWLKDFMKTPYAIRPILVERMPRLKISDSEVETLYSYFRTTLVDDRVEKLTGSVKEMSLKDPEVISLGKDLYYNKYACNACHQVNLKGGTIGPDLTSVGERLRTEWIVYYLSDPKAFLKRSIEPVYDFTEKELEALTAFLLSAKEKK